ncbi:MAG: hypothetical protein ABOK23_08455 [Candidatus Methanoperedens sp.]|nr:hypothetical protein [Candidatus Methanoperedens sp.]MCZ7396396.1 hypothetical protein [Candidatus Methanoperedens sp.]
MKSNENKSIKTQIKIILSLLDGSNKPQRQIAKEIEKEESTVSKALRYLEKDKVVAVAPQIINSGRRNKGMYKNNLCRLSYEVDSGFYVLNFFRSVFAQKTFSKQEENELLNTLQKNDKILEMLVKKQDWLIDYEKARQKSEPKPIDCDMCLRDLPEPCPSGCPSGGDEQQRQSCLKFRKENPKYIVPTYQEFEKSKAELEKNLNEMNEALKNELKNKFKNRLRMSPYFFKACLTNTHEELEEQLTKIYNLTVDAHLEKHPLSIFSLGFLEDAPEVRTWVFFDKIFEICVVHDIMENEASEEAKKDVLEMNRHKANVLEDIECLGIRTYYEDPDFLKSMYEQEWAMRNPKLKSVRLKSVRNKPE